MGNKAMSTDHYAEEILSYFRQDLIGAMHTDVCITFLKNILTSYAEARVKEAEDRLHLNGGYNLKDIWEARNAGHAEGRIEAIEECAQIAFSFSSPLQSKSPIVEAQRNTADSIGTLIRQLKVGVK